VQILPSWYGQEGGGENESAGTALTAADIKSAFPPGTDMPNSGATSVGEIAPPEEVAVALPVLPTNFGANAATLRIQELEAQVAALCNALRPQLAASAEVVSQADADIDLSALRQTCATTTTTTTTTTQTTTTVTSTTVTTTTSDTAVVFTFKELDYAATDVGMLEANLRTAIVELTPITQQTMASVAMTFEAGSIVATAEFPDAASAKQARAKADDIVELASKVATTTTTATSTTATTTTTTTTTTLPLYTLAPTGSGECPVGYSRVVDKDECEHAGTLLAAQRQQTQGRSIQSGDWGHVPK